MKNLLIILTIGMLYGACEKESMESYELQDTTEQVLDQTNDNNKNNR